MLARDDSAAHIQAAKDSKAEEKEVKIIAPKPREIELPRVSAVNRLRFSPYAWAYYHWLRDRSRNEVAAFAISK